MKQFLILFVTILFCSQSYAQTKQVRKLYKLYNSREFVKCVENSDKLIEKDAYNIEAYYVKAIAYFEMAQLPEKYTNFTKDPLMDCVRTLSVLRSKDPDGEMWEEHDDTLKMIYKYADYTAQQLKKTNKDKAILLYQRLMRAYKIQTNALELALIYAKVEDYESCMKQVSRLYDKSPSTIASTDDNYESLCKGAHLLAENWMFRDLFWLIETYKPKFEQNWAINEGFKSAIMISIDTAQAEEDKTYFYDFSEKGLALYGDNSEFKSFVVRQWEDVINKSLKEYRLTEGNRTWRDSVIIRNTYKHLDKALELMPEEQVFVSKKKSLDAEFHTIPYISEKDLFIQYALEAVNKRRTEGCECDTGYVFKIRPVYAVEWDTTLARLAQTHAQEMFTFNYTDDINQADQNPWDRINETRLKGDYYETATTKNFVKATKIGEILGYGYTLSGVSTEEDLQQLLDNVVNSWIQTRLSQNCPKIMTPNFSHMGLGMYGDKWVLMFANISDIVIKTK